MAVSFLSYDHTDDDDFIDMEVSSFSNFCCHSTSSPKHPSEFEFQMSSDSLIKEQTTSPADELFYRGKLLPLLLPPRMQMVDELLENSASVYNCRNETFDEFYSIPLVTTGAITPTTRSAPFESCNISPSDSCRLGRELKLEDYLFEYSSEVSGFICENPRRSWTKKLKLIKQSFLGGSKLKASRVYLRSLFCKTGCSGDSRTTAAKVADEGTVSRDKDSLRKYAHPVKKNLCAKIPNDRYGKSRTAMRDAFSKQMVTDDCRGSLQSRSFSMAVKCHLTPKSSSSALSSPSDSYLSLSATLSRGLPFLRRSSSSKTEIENPIQGAIAHCKESQLSFRPRKTATEVGFCSSKITSCEE